MYLVGIADQSDAIVYFPEDLSWLSVEVSTQELLQAWISER